MYVRVEFYLKWIRVYSAFDCGVRTDWAEWSVRRQTYGLQASIIHAFESVAIEIVWCSARVRASSSSVGFALLSHFLVRKCVYHVRYFRFHSHCCICSICHFVVYARPVASRNFFSSLFIEKIFWENFRFDFSVESNEVKREIQLNLKCWVHSMAMGPSMSWT